MSHYATEVLNDPAPAGEPELMGLEVELMLVEFARERAVEDQHTAHMNPLGLVGTDLTAVGWDCDTIGQTWFHLEHGSMSFLDATRVEADKVSPVAPERF